MDNKICFFYMLCYKGKKYKAIASMLAYLLMKEV